MFITNVMSFSGNSVKGNKLKTKLKIKKLSYITWKENYLLVNYNNKII